MVNFLVLFATNQQDKRKLIFAKAWSTMEFNKRGRFLFALDATKNRPLLRATQAQGRSVTQARRLYAEKQTSVQATDPRHGAAHKVPSRHPWLQGHSAPSMASGCALPPMRQGPLPPSMAPVTLDHHGTLPSMAVL
ncbi:MAG: hypothetical protein P4L59_14640 [Desulfosporosinus sp.]|nr:hypothetical protein [Desulfosporosinus sp.]